MELEKDVFLGRIVEAIVRGERRNLRKLINLLDNRDMLESFPAPCLYDVHVQGGERTPAAIRRAEIGEKIAQYDSQIVRVADTFRNVSDAKLTAYVYALLDGLEEDELVKRARLGKSTRKRYQRWLVKLLGYEGVGVSGTTQMANMKHGGDRKSNQVANLPDDIFQFQA